MSKPNCTKKISKINCKVLQMSIKLKIKSEILMKVGKIAGKNFLSKLWTSLKRKAVDEFPSEN